MKKHWWLIWTLMAAVSCHPNRSQEEKPVVSVSILPQQYFVERLAGDLLEVNVMVPPGASPATYEPTVQQLRNLQRSPLYLRIGYVEFELGWMRKIEAANPAMRIVDLSEGIVLMSGEEAGMHPETDAPADEEALQTDGHDHHDHSHTGVDPHIWMSAPNASIMARHTCKALSEAFPQFEQLLAGNLELLLQDIDSLHRQISVLFEPHHSAAFMIYHPALTYFARDYHLEQHPLEMGGKTPSPRHMKQMIDTGREKKISAIFIQQQFDQRNASVLAEEIGARVIQIDPLSPDWMEEMNHIARQLKASFQ